MNKRMGALVDRLDQFLNPILVKEVYQGFRNKAFISWYFIAVLVCLNAYLVVPLGDFYTENTGRILFGWLYACVAVVAVFVVPFGSGRQLRDEIESHAMELIAITHLTPGEVLNGRFQAALLKIMLLCAYFGPFVSIAFLYGGIGNLESMLLVLWLVLLSAVIIAVTLTLNAATAIVGANTVSRFLIPALFLAIFTLVPTLFVAVWSFTMLGGGVGLSWLDQWPLWVLGAVVILMICRFILSLGAQFLTPAGLRDSRYPKLWLLGIVMMQGVGFAASVGYEGWNGGQWQVMAALFMASSSGVVWWLVAFWMGQPTHQPMRLQYQLQAASGWRRGLYWIFTDGYYYSLLYYIVISGTLLIPVLLLDKLSLADKYTLLGIWGLSVMYLIYWTGIACFINSLRKRPSTYSYIAIFLGVVGVTLFLSVVLQSSSQLKPHSVWLVFFPLSENLHFDYPLEWVLVPVLIGGGLAYWGSKRISRVNGNAG